MTTTERYLMESQDLIQTRGKKGTIVPLLIPPECKRVCNFLADGEVRAKININSQNVYLFPQRLDLGPLRAYNSLNTVCSEIDLAKPEQITSTSLRKYMATLAQVMNLAPNELQWVCRHLGHTEKVHLAHYRTMSPFIERVNIGKVLMIQDLNIQSKFVGKKLDEVDFIDIIMNQNERGAAAAVVPEVPSTSADEVPSTSDAPDPSVGSPDPDDDCSGRDSDPDYTGAGLHGSDTDEEGLVSHRNKNKNVTRRQRWTVAEEHEIKKYFHSNLQSKTTPRMSECLKAKRSSLKDGGQLHKRYWHLIVKKVSAIIQKQKKK